MEGPAEEAGDSPPAPPAALTGRAAGPSLRLTRPQDATQDPACSSPAKGHREKAAPPAARLP